VFALLTFQDASIMFVPVKAGDVAPVQTYDGDTAFSTEELSSGNGHYTVRVRVPDLERDTLLSMTAMNTTRKVLLHVSQVAWEAQPTTASSTRTAFITTTTQAASELPAAVPVTESTTVITTTITSPKTTTERMTTEIVPTTIAEQPQSKAIFPILAGAAGVVILVLAGVVLLPRQRSKRK
jgi:hypothetical protein